MAYTTTALLENTEIAPGIRSMKVRVEEQVWPGQFYMLRRPDSDVLLPRAISVCDWKDGVARFCYQVVGKGTAGFARMKKGDAICLTGPLGNGFPVEALRGRVALVGGGIGAAPMVYTARQLRAKGVKVQCFVGYRDQPFLLKELEEASGAEVMVATETGRMGYRGYITGMLHPETCNTVLVCGPEPMMKACSRLCMESDTPVYVSLENRMACGVGACLVCTCTDLLGKNRRTCKDGPVFRGEEINFDA